MASSSTTVAQFSREPRSYLLELGQHRCQQILRELKDTKDGDGQPIVKHDPDTGCELYQGKLTPSGHWSIQRTPRIRVRDSRRTGRNQAKPYFVHRLAYVALNNADVEETASHLCGNGSCCNPYHIYDEPIGLNVSRIGCIGPVMCQEHQHILGTSCRHQPPCIKKPFLLESCCLTLSTRQPAIPPFQSGDSQTPQQTAFEEFLDQELPPSQPPWPDTSQEMFDVTWEIASDDATPPPTEDTGPIQPPPELERASLPPWESQDLASQEPVEPHYAIRGSEVPDSQDTPDDSQPRHHTGDSQVHESSDYVP